VVAIGVLRVLALLLRILGNGARHLGKLTQQVYDLFLFVPLWIETRMAAAAAAEAAEDAAEAASSVRETEHREMEHRLPVRVEALPEVHS